MPLARVTGMRSESGLTATAARTSGVMSPSSRKSVVTPTDIVSTRPSALAVAMSPGYTCRPFASITFVPGRIGAWP